MTDSGARLASGLDHVVATHGPQVRLIARRIARRLSPTFELDDLVSEGTIGLLDAAQKFDPDRGVPFRLYASRRIAGAILDYVRREAPVSRSAYAAVVAGHPERGVWLEPIETIHLTTLVSPAPTPEAQTIARDRSAQVRDRLARLPWRERVIVVGYATGRLNAALAVALSCSCTRISQLQARGFQRLRETWGPVA